MKAWYLAFAACLIGAKAWGHHSFAAVYLEDQEVTIEGRLVQFLWRNPHTLVHVMVEQDDGTNVRYVVEWGSATQLGRVRRNASNPEARRLRDCQPQSRPQRGGQPRAPAQLPQALRWFGPGVFGPTRSSTKARFRTAAPQSRGQPARRSQERTCHGRPRPCVDGI